MANNYSSGTIKTNFNEQQQEFFQRRAFCRHQIMLGEADSDESANALYDAEIAEWDFFPDIFEQEGSSFWDMENFDLDSAIDAINDTFAAFPDSGLRAEISVAWYCDKPRLGEFGGYTKLFEQGVKDVKIVPDSSINMIWKCPETDEEISVNPDWYQENGTPISPHSGDDCIYLRTEIDNF